MVLEGTEREGKVARLCETLYAVGRTLGPTLSRMGAREWMVVSQEGL
jgi:hypothetical protein